MEFGGVCRFNVSSLFFCLEQEADVAMDMIFVYFFLSFIEVENLSSFQRDFRSSLCCYSVSDHRRVTTDFSQSLFQTLSTRHTQLDTRKCPGLEKSR